ncbi:hypothetical protein C8R46DRAFT_1060273 [Mycena filopes]|nr:hypothetical protein C8R46DRAFT_1060273 [Mycena filopes]
MPLAPGTRESYIGVFLENIVYGFYLSVFIESSLLLWRKQKAKGRHASHAYVIATTIAMFILITMRCVLDTIRCIEAFKSEALDFGPPNTKLGTITNACWFFVTAVADAFIIFRTYIVWKRNWYVIVLPTLLFLGNFASSIWLIYSIIKFDPATPVFGEITKSVDAFIYLTLFTNVLCTGLIASRIFYVRRNASVLVTAGGRYDDLATKIISSIVESAAIYTLLLVGQLITNRLGSFVNYVVVNCTPATIGLVFSYIIIRVSRGTSYGDSSANTTTSGGQTSLSLSRERDPRGHGHGLNQTFELSSTARNPRSGEAVQVKLERVIHSDHDMGSSEHSVQNRGKYGEAEEMV